MNRRRYRPLTTGANPTLESLTRRKPSRRIFRELQRSGASPIPPLWANYERQYKLLGPLTSDTSVIGYTEPWEYWGGGPQQIWGEGPYNDYGSPDIDVTGVPHWIWYEKGNKDFYGPWGGPYDKKMRPVRFRTDSFINPYWTSQFFYRGAEVCQLQNSAKSPPPTSDRHFSGSRTSAIRLPRSLVYATSYASTSLITHARVLVDGVDVSGVHAFASPIQMAVNNLLYKYANLSSPIFDIPLPSPVVISGESVIEFDLWIRVKVSGVGPGRVWNTGYTTTQGTVINNWIYTSILGVMGSHAVGNVGTPIMTRAAFGEINVHRSLRGTENWIVAFTGGTVGGLSSLTMQPQTGWTFSRNGTSILMTKTTGTGVGDRVQFSYGTETPELRIFKNAQMINGGGWMRYLTESPSFYGPTGPGGKQFAPITVNSSNIMLPAAKQQSNSPGGFIPYWLPIEEAFPSQIALHPTSITLSK